jgi:hypothetical protein
VDGQDDRGSDIGMYRGIEYIDRKGIHEMAKTLEELGKAMEGWSAQPGGGVHVRSDHDLREAASRQRMRLEEQRERMEERRRQQAELRDGDQEAPPGETEQA